MLLKGLNPRKENIYLLKCLVENISQKRNPLYWRRKTHQWHWRSKLPSVETATHKEPQVASRAETAPQLTAARISNLSSTHHNELNSDNNQWAWTNTLSIRCICGSHHPLISAWWAENPTTHAQTSNLQNCEITHLCWVSL